MTSGYANVCNVASTREEVVLLFGTSQSWQPAPDGEITVRLDHRVILSPFAAKRLARALANVVEQYEARFGRLDDQGPGAQGAAPTSPPSPARP